MMSTQSEIAKTVTIIFLGIHCLGVYSGGWNTKGVLNSNGNPLYGFPTVFRFEQNGGHFVQNRKSEQNGYYFFWIYNGLVF